MNYREEMMKRAGIKSLKKETATNEELEEALMEIAQNQSDLEEALVELAELITEVE